MAKHGIRVSVIDSITLNLHDLGITQVGSVSNSWEGPENIHRLVKFLHIGLEPRYVRPHLTNHLHGHLRRHRNIAKEQVQKTFDKFVATDDTRTIHVEGFEQIGHAVH
mmetsp:Transcript_10191/g.21236  ORF Transcript_10191/g.21236 Transcript_10191/m.21236 type:complete len:108 (+) Transcript_10191:190-513(+)